MPEKQLSQIYEIIMLQKTLVIFMKNKLVIPV